MDPDRGIVPFFFSPLPGPEAPEPPPRLRPGDEPSPGEAPRPRGLPRRPDRAGGGEGPRGDREARREGAGGRPPRARGGGPRRRVPVLAGRLRGPRPAPGGAPAFPCSPPAWPVEASSVGWGKVDPTVTSRAYARSSTLSTDCTPSATARRRWGRLPAHRERPGFAPGPATCDTHRCLPAVRGDAAGVVPATVSEGDALLPKSAVVSTRGRGSDESARVAILAAGIAKVQEMR